MPETATPPATLDLTLIHSANGISVRKTVELADDGSIRAVEGYPDGLKWWTRSTRTVPHDIDALHSAIADISAVHNACLVTGEAIGSIALDKPVQRLKIPRENTPATLGECSAAWLPIDCDKVPLSAPIDPIDPEAAVAGVVSKLGAPFDDCSYVWQLTSSATPGADRLSVRLFFLVDQAITNAQRSAWAKGLNHRVGVQLVDKVLYSAAQPIYSAAPAFKGHDPFPRRCGVVYGENESVPWDCVPITEVPKRATYTGADFTGEVHRSIAECLAAIGDRPDQEGFHVPINSAICKMVWHKWTPDRIKAVIREVALLADCSRHSSAYVQKQLTDYELNRSIKGAANFVKISQVPPRVTQTRTVDKPVPLKKAQAQAREIVRQWKRGEGPAKVVLKMTLGGGKTTIAAEMVREMLGADETLLWSFPTHEQGAEVQNLLNAGFWNRQAIKIEGRVRAGAEDPLCKRPELIGAIRAAKKDRWTASIACQRGNESCPHLRGCSYYQQFTGHERVRLIPHDLLRYPKARAFESSFMDRCAGLVIDESPLGQLVGDTRWTLAQVAEHGGLLADVVNAIKDGSELDREATIEALTAEMDERCQPESDVPLHGPSEGNEWALIKELESIAANPAAKFRALYRAVLAWLGGDINLVWFGKVKGKETGIPADAVFCAWKHELPPVERVLILDATADEEVYKALIGEDVHVETIHVEQNLKIYQAQDVPVGKRKLTDAENDGLLVRAVGAALMLGGGFISNKSAVELATSQDYIPKGHPVAHFNNLRGLNSLSSLRALVITGRPEPDALTVEAVARALWPREALELTGAYAWRQDGLSSVASHPDARCDSLLRMYREAEILQAIGRLRAVWAEETKTVILLTHTPIGLPVTHKPLSELVPAESLARLIISGRGVAPLVPALMVKMVPGFWLNENAAELDIRRNLKPSFPLYKSLYKQIDGFKFRTTGQKRQSFALSFLDDFDTWKRLEELTAREVVDCQRVEAETTPAPAEEVTPTEAEELLSARQKLPTSEPTPLISRSSLYARLMGGRPKTDSKFRQSPRNARPPDWGALVQPIPTFTFDAQLAF